MLNSPGVFEIRGEEEGPQHVSQCGTKSSAHMKWKCKYHIVVVQKYSRQAFYGGKKRALGENITKIM